MTAPSALISVPLLHPLLPTFPTLFSPVLFSAWKHLPARYLLVIVKRTIVVCQSNVPSLSSSSLLPSSPPFALLPPFFSSTPITHPPLHNSSSPSSLLFSTGEDLPIPPFLRLSHRIGGVHTPCPFPTTHTLSMKPLHMRCLRRQYLLQLRWCLPPNQRHANRQIDGQRVTDCLLSLFLRHLDKDYTHSLNRIRLILLLLLLLLSFISHLSIISWRSQSLSH